MKNIFSSSRNTPETGNAQEFAKSIQIPFDPHHHTVHLNFIEETLESDQKVLLLQIRLTGPVQIDVDELGDPVYEYDVELFSYTTSSLEETKYYVSMFASHANFERRGAQRIHVDAEPEAGYDEATNARYVEDKRLSIYAAGSGFTEFNFSRKQTADFEGSEAASRSGARGGRILGDEFKSYVQELDAFYTEWERDNFVDPAIRTKKQPQDFEQHHARYSTERTSAMTATGGLPTFEEDGISADTAQELEPA